MHFVKYSTRHIQNVYIESFPQANDVKNSLVFNLISEIIQAGIDYHSSGHDNKIAATQGVYSLRLSESYNAPRFSFLLTVHPPDNLGIFTVNK